MYQTHTGIRLYACRDFTSSNVIEKGNILAKHCLKIVLSDTLRVDFTGIHPHIHVQVRAKEYSNALYSEVKLERRILMIETRTHAHQVYRKHACLVTEVSCRSRNSVCSTRDIVVGLVNNLREVDELLGKVSEEKGHERLEG
jgi:hypothetical protein